MNDARLLPTGFEPSFVNRIVKSDTKMVSIDLDFSIPTLMLSMVAVNGMEKPKLLATRASEMLIKADNETVALELSLAVIFPGLDQALKKNPKSTFVPVPGLFGPSDCAIITVQGILTNMDSQIKDSNLRLRLIASQF